MAYLCKRVYRRTAAEGILRMATRNLWDGRVEPASKETAVPRQSLRSDGCSDMERPSQSDISIFPCDNGGSVNTAKRSTTTESKKQRKRRPFQLPVLHSHLPSLPSSTPCPMSQQDPAEASCNPRRSRSFLFFTALVFLFVQAGLFAGHLSANRRVTADQPATLQLPHGPTRLTGSVPEHPIPYLMDDAERRFRALLSRQSRSLRAAVAEYKRRYGRNPPKGFDAWWRFAQENKVKMIDEYDSLVGDLEPFWGMTGTEFRQRAFQVCTSGHSYFNASAKMT